MNDIEIVSPPWTLTGYGYLLLYKLPESVSTSFVTHGAYKGGLSSIIIANYIRSGVGPYEEIMFIPGVVQYQQTKGYSVTQIYVSTMDSVINGQRHWGLPKQFAHFSFEQRDQHTEQIQASDENGNQFANLTLSASGIQFPIRGFILPRIHQEYEGRTIITRLHAQGWGQWAKLTHAEFDNINLPDISSFRPLAAIKITSFTMIFPEPTIKS